MGTLRYLLSAHPAPADLSTAQRYLDLPDLLKAGCVCKGWYALHNDGYLWKKLYLDSFLHYGFVSIPDQGDDILAKDQQMKRLQELRELELRQHETTQAIGFFKQILQHGYLLLNRWRNGTFSSCELVLFPDKEPSTSTIAWEEEEEDGEYSIPPNRTANCYLRHRS